PARPPARPTVPCTRVVTAAFTYAWIDTVRGSRRFRAPSSCKEDVMPFSTKEWTADELLHEARRREREAASPDRTRSGMSTGGRARDLSRVPTGELVHGARDRQRVIYGTDNRKDIYQITSQAARRSADAVVALVKSSDL